MTPDALLTGPRGRRMLAELAGMREVEGLLATAWSGRSHVSVLGTAPAPARTRLDARPRTDLADDLATLVLDRLGRAGDDGRVNAAIATTVTMNMPWQPPDEEDQLLADPVFDDALRPLAVALCAGPVAERLRRPVAVDRQRLTLFHLAPPSGSVPVPDEVLPDGTFGRTARPDTNEAPAVRATAPGDDAPDEAFSGEWWSIPLGPWAKQDDPDQPGTAPLTSPPLGPWAPSDAGAGSSQLVWVEDESDWHAATIVPVRPRYTPRIVELTGPQDCADLVRRFPMRVTPSRRGDWYRHTGRDGEWAVPDWAAAREDVDGVHVTVAGYLTTAGLAVEVGDGVASVLAGWSPDLTAWLTDVLEETGEREVWERTENGLDERESGWRRREA